MKKYPHCVFSAWKKNLETQKSYTISWILCNMYFENMPKMLKWNITLHSWICSYLEFSQKVQVQKKFYYLFICKLECFIIFLNKAKLSLQFWMCFKTLNPKFKKNRTKTKAASVLPVCWVQLLEFVFRLKRLQFYPTSLKKW